MLNKDQSQEASNGATALQAGRDIIVGISASEARNIALDVAKATFYELSGDARNLASSRVEEITNKVIDKLESEFPEGLWKARDPDFQYALLTVQKQYARNGDTDLGDLLVDLLVDRSKQEKRDILQIVLNESLETAPKLTDSQLSNLAVIFLFKYTENHKVLNFYELGNYFDAHVKPFVSLLTKSQASFQHLEFAGCGTIQMADMTLEDVLFHTYGGLFMAGFDQSQVTTVDIPESTRNELFMPCMNNSQKMQVRMKNLDTLKAILAEKDLPQNIQSHITSLYEDHRLSNEDIQKKCIEVRPYMSDMFDAWNNSSMKAFTMTSVGMAIGHANIKRHVGQFADLSIWIN